jgi:hypothetical protein
MSKTNKLQEFKKAILYLKRKERIRNNADVATALEISSSYLSQMLHGNKPVTEVFYKKFETQFAINLNDPFTYTDLDWVTLPNQTPDAPDNNQELFNSMKSLLLLKDEEIENQRRIISSQQKLVTILQKEIDCMKPVFDK